MRREARVYFAVLSLIFSLIFSCEKLESHEAATGPTPCQSCSVVRPPVQYLYASLQNSGMIVGYQVNLGDYKTLTPVRGSPFRSAPGTYGLVLHPNLKFLYAANYNDRANVITGFSIDYETGALKPIGRFRGGRGPAEMIFHPSGRFLYVSNWRSSGNISAYRVDSDSGHLSELEGSPFRSGLGPRSLAIDAKGRFLFVANTQSHSISGYEINPVTGALTPTPGSPISGNGLKNPDGLLMVSEGAGILVSNLSNTNISLSGFFVSEKDGALTPMEQSPYLHKGRCQTGCGLFNFGSGGLNSFLVYGGKEGVISPGFFYAGSGPVLRSSYFVAPPGTSFLNDIALNDSARGFILSSYGNTISSFWSDIPWGGGGGIVSRPLFVIPSKYRIDAGKLLLTPVFYL